MITLKSLKLHNFLSHETTEINFDESQKLLIDGNSGSGKSSILEAIIWAFYGSGRSSNSSLIRRGADKATVQLTLDNDGQDVVINRSVNASKHNLTIEIDGVAHPKTGVRELQDWIESDLTGASYMLFVNSIAYLQGGAESFVGQNAGKRKELLLEIIKTIDFETYYERVKSVMANMEINMAVASGESAVALQEIETAKSYVDKKEQVISTIATLDASSKKLQDEKEALDKLLEGRSERNNEVATKDKELVRLTERRADVMNKIEACHNKLSTFKELVSQDEEDTDALFNERTIAGEKLNTVRESIANVAQINADRAKMLQEKPVDRGFENTITALGKEIDDMGGSNLCPEGEKCPNFRATFERIQAKREEKARIEFAYETFKTDLATWESKFNLMVEIPVGELQVQEKKESLEVEILTERIKNAETIKAAKIQSLETEETLLTWTHELSSTLATITTLEAQVAELKKFGDTEEERKASVHYPYVTSQLHMNELKFNEAQRELGVIENFENTIPLSQEKAGKASQKLVEIQNNLQTLTLLKDAFGSKGIKALVIDYIIPELEEKINSILSQMSDFRVILDTQQEKASGDGSKEGLFITIVNDMGEEMPFENYSGGEKLKIVVAITEALATLQKCGFRLFDETFVGLDDSSLESFTQVLDTLLDRFPQVICVSHLTEIKAAFDNQIKIVKHNGVSRIE